MINILKKIVGLGNDEDLKGKILEGAFLVDVRSPQEYDAGHVKGSSNIPLERIQFSLSTFQNKKNIIVFCRSGHRSSQAKSILNKNGFKNVTNGRTWQSINDIIKKS